MVTSLLKKSFHLPGFAKKALLFASLAAAYLPATAQNTPAPALYSATIAAKANRAPVEKSYRMMMRAMNSFDAQRGFENDLQSSFKCLGSAPTTLLRATRWSNVANAPPLLTANASR